jgi:hypothetical protein
VQDAVAQNRRIKMFTKLKELLTEWRGDPEPFEFTYKGKKVRYEGMECGDDEVNKTCHSVFIDGKEYRLDFSPYATATQKDIELWIDCGMPNRKDLNTNGPIRPDELKKYLASKGVQQ